MAPELLPLGVVGVPPGGMPVLSPPLDAPELVPAPLVSPDRPPEVLPEVPEVPDVPDFPGVAAGGVPGATDGLDGLDGLAPGDVAVPGAVLSVPPVPAPVPDDFGGVAGASDGGGVVAGAVVVPALPDVPPA